jgi:glucose/arabinose dehydrogenase
MKRIFVFTGILIIVLVSTLSLGFKLSEKSLLGEQRMEGKEVIQCTNQSWKCDKSYIKEYRTNCDPYQPWDPYSKLECDYSKEGLEKISLVTDSANYVRSPMTDQKYETSQFYETGGETWDLEFLPSGKPIWTNRQNGRIRTIRRGRTSQSNKIEIVSDGETGLLGLAVDPNFEQNKYLYIYYTKEKQNNSYSGFDNPLFQNRVSRFKYIDGKLRSEEILIEVNGSRYHSGGRLEFGPDKKLYVTTGEAGLFYKAANKSSLVGKILRINNDGSNPIDNPFNDSPVYSMGHRNPQGIAWQPETKQLYSTEHGNWRYDELNKIEPGKKYGWSGYECDRKIFFGDYRNKVNAENLTEYYRNTEPAYCWKNWTMAPSGIEFVNETGHPWHGDLFVAGLRGKQIMRFIFKDEKITRKEIFYTTSEINSTGLRMRDVEFQNGKLYAITDSKGIIAITPTESHIIPSSYQDNLLNLAHGLNPMQVFHSHEN